MIQPGYGRQSGISLRIVPRLDTEKVLRKRFIVVAESREERVIVRPGDRDRTLETIGVCDQVTDCICTVAEPVKGHSLRIYKTLINQVIHTA